MTDEENEKSLHDRVKDDIAEAFRAGDRHRTDVLRTLLGDAVKDARRKEVRLPTDAEMIGHLRKFVANAELMASSLERAGRPEDAARSRSEAAFLSEYLPPSVSDDDVRTFLSGLKASGALPAGNAAMGAAMKALRDRYGDSFDGRTMTPLVKEALSS